MTFSLDTGDGARVPSNCLECGHSFHPAGRCVDPLCRCQRNMAVSLPIDPNKTVPMRPARTERQILSDIAALLFDMRTELQHIRAALAASGAVSSVQLEQGAKGDVRLTVKTYAESEPPVDDALDAFGRAYREIDARQMRQWADTLEMVQRDRGER